MVKYSKATLYKGKDKVSAMNYIQIDHLIWETSKTVREKEKDAFNGTMDKSMMENGRAARNTEAEFGKIKMDCLTWENGGEILSRGLEF